ncbi:gluconate 2-dehydrogenase subunit 3 family protein [Parvularcula flava]|uniref:Gluconate 2-dehydrogenase subunit 3 family protein n=1 Tax=Aquisalinus luteolus TaxID=1566827 RepID=A0A8J2ZZX5_9PROT|nr:gluconate 2-dehydrogenase subunit 3 family protein [Aquisalinus luteolus]NHK26298.1 gluconate 2-dehydrogenase subunit 3 family protein [Aquisalinus luteolus]GGH91908.1 hypothetical protein GCM10011355_00160 [Aquisalinus luteolus]
MPSGSKTSNKGGKARERVWTRRQLLAGFGAAYGVALAGCSGEDRAARSATAPAHPPVLPIRGDEVFFRARALHILEIVSDILIPRTSTPGAADAGVSGVIDEMMVSWASADTQQQFITALTDFDMRAHETYQRYFLKLTGEEQFAVVDAIDAEAFGQDGHNQPYRRLKSLIFHVYDTSEPANPDYRLVPGAYRGNLSWQDYQAMLAATE